MNNKKILGLIGAKYAYTVTGILSRSDLRKIVYSNYINHIHSELVKKEQSFDKFKHMFSGIILTLSAANKLQLQQMKEGGRYVVVVEKRWKGVADADAFDVFGIDSGLELNVATYNSNESDGTATIELSSVDSYEEPKIPVNLLLTDYATTKTAFDNKFIQA